MNFRRFVLSALLLAFSALLLSGCGANFSENQVSGSAVGSPAPGPRINTIQVTGLEPDLAIDGTPVKILRLIGFDGQGAIVYGPTNVPYPTSVNAQQEGEGGQGQEVTFTGLPDEVRGVRLDYKRAPGFTLAQLENEVDFPNDEDGIVFVLGSNPMPLGAERETFTLRIVNNSEYSDEEVFVSINGKDRNETAFFYLAVNPTTHVGTFAQFGGVDRASDYSFKLTDLKKVGEHTYSLNCPVTNLVSGRIYLSFGQKLQGLGLNDISNPLGLQLPSPSGMPDAQTLYEFMELSVTSPEADPSNWTLYANTSVVDFFSIGLGMTLYTQQGQQEVSQVVGFVPGARDQVLAAFEAGTTPTEFRNYVVKDGTTTVLRVLAPVQGVAINPNGALASFLGPAIDAAWNHYAQVVLNIPDTLAEPYGYQWTGQAIVNSTLPMTCTAKPAGDNAGGDLESLGEVCLLPKPTTRIVFFCDDDQPLAPGTAVRDTWKNDGSQGHKRLVSLLSAALNRGVMENYEDWNKADKFYTRADGRYNHYSKIMHQFALNGKVYGFGYDDVYGQDPTLVSPLPQVNRLELQIPPIPRL